MNVENNLFLIKGEDKTNKIIYCEYINGKYCVTFDNQKKYHYNYSNCKWIKNPIHINSQTVTLYKNNEAIDGIKHILRFEEYLKIFFENNSTKVYPICSITIEETCLKNKDSNNCFQYLKKLAEDVSIKLDNDCSFLGKQYNKIKNISPRSVLAIYLNPIKIKQEKRINQIIYPFGFNISQKEATEKALTNQISVIEGPPGTGKTQTILNIIANAIINDKTVAVVSNNNSATANILEKLENCGLDFIAAYLGNKENRETFLNSQKGIYPDMVNWKIEKAVLTGMKENLINSEKTLNEMLIKQNSLAKLKQEKYQLITEREYFIKYFENKSTAIEPYKSIYKHNSNKVMSLLVEYENVIKNYGKFSLVNKIKNLIYYGITSFKFYQNNPEDITDNLKSLYYEYKLSEIDSKINDLEKTLEHFDFKNVMNEYTDNSKKILKDKIAKKFSKNSNRVIFSKNDIAKKSKKFTKEYPIILSTTHSLRSCISENFLFDYVIVDEASQVDIITGALSFSCARNAVIVGDLKQLPNVVSSDIAKRSDFIFKEYNLNNAYIYAENSLLSSITSLYEDVPKTLLREHYRCHPKIIDFCNKKFYDNKLIILTNEGLNDKPLAVYKTVKGNHSRGNLNQRQIDVITKEIIPNLIKDNDMKSIGIISPYVSQATELKNILNDTNIEIDTVHKYQGREKNIVILTTVANKINDFIDNPNLLNVAISRAQNKFILVVSDNYTDTDNSNICDLIKYIQYNNLEVINSEIFSVFDLLYNSYSKELITFLKKNKRVSEFDSENLMNTILEKILSNKEFRILDKVIHQPLRMLIRDTSKLTKEELKFVMNSLTHIDFLIFNKMDKIPILVIEVDGYAFHANNPRQLNRDKMKDEILWKYNIPILRINTNGSGEEEKIHKKLTEIMRKINMD